MAKGRPRDAPFRTVVDAGGRADWLRGKRYGQVGYVEPTEPPKIMEVYEPVLKGPKTPLAWRADDHGPLPGGGRSLREQAQQYHDEKRGVAGRLKNLKRKGKSLPASQQDDATRQGSMKMVANHNSRRIALALTERRDHVAEPQPVQESAALPVPVPSERVRPENVTYASREGQQEFRRAIIAAYGRCAVTGCRVEEALEAAHIIPYVDARSNLVSNGLCLRADVHRLYDRSLITIDAAGVVAISATIMDGYREISGARIAQPDDERSRPNPLLLSSRNQFVAER